MATKSPASAESKSSIQVIERMGALFDVLARHPETVTLKQLAQDAGLHPSTAHRILSRSESTRLNSSHTDISRMPSSA